jgi:hypothetical protein
MTAFYSGYSKNAILLGQNTITYVVHFYNQKEHWANLLGSSGNLLSKIRYLYWGGS